MWAVWPEVLANYAKHYQTGEPMPQALLDKMLAAKKFNQGYMTTEYLAATMLDQAWHQLSPEEVPDGRAGFEAEALQQGRRRLTRRCRRATAAPYFSHVFSGGYSAGYYSYIWSEVLDADTVEWFKEHGGLKRENGDRFRAMLLSRGGSEDAHGVVPQFHRRRPRHGAAAQAPRPGSGGAGALSARRFATVAGARTCLLRNYGDMETRRAFARICSCLRNR